MISKPTNEEGVKKKVLAKNVKIVIAGGINIIDGIKYKLDFGRNILLFDFCGFAANRLNDELLPQGLLLGLELALHDFLETEIGKKDQKKTNSLRSHFTVIASLFGNDFSSEFKKKFNEIHKTDGIFGIINSILSGDDDKVKLIAEVITSTESQGEDTKGAVLQRELSIGHKVRVLESDKYIKGEIIDTSAGDNLLIIKTNDGRLITKFRGEVNHIKSPERYIETTESIESKTINSISYFQQNQSFYGANIGIRMPVSINWESFKLAIGEIGIQIKCGLAGNGEGLGVYVYPSDYSKLSDLLVLIDDAGCEVFNLEGVKDSIPLLKKFTGKGSSFDKHSSFNIDRGYKILSDDEDDGMRSFSSVLERCCLENGFLKGLELLKGVADRALNEGIKINLVWLLNYSNIHEYILGDVKWKSIKSIPEDTKIKNIKGLLEFTSNFFIKNSQINDLIQNIQSPYNKSSYSFEFIHKIMGTNSKGYPESINKENVKLVLEGVSKYYMELGIPVEQTQYSKGYDKFFQYIMQHLGFNLEDSYKMSLSELNGILLEFKKYGVDENDDNAGAKKSREKVLKKIN